jgi:hypothetical protein
LGRLRFRQAPPQPFDLRSIEPDGSGWLVLNRFANFRKPIVGRQPPGTLGVCPEYRGHFFDPEQIRVARSPLLYFRHSFCRNVNPQHRVALPPLASIPVNVLTHRGHFPVKGFLADPQLLGSVS